MTQTVIHAAAEQGKFRRALAAVWSFMQALDYSSLDYTTDRIKGVEQEVGRLKEEIRQIRDLMAVNAHTPSADGPEH